MEHLVRLRNTVMGIERSVTLWYLHRQILLNELAVLEAQLVQIHAASDSEAAQPETLSPDCAAVKEQYERVQEKLCNLGPCPKPMMG
jgi:hypothetical protein